MLYVSLSTIKCYLPWDTGKNYQIFMYLGVLGTSPFCSLLFEVIYMSLVLQLKFPHLLGPDSYLNNV